MNKRVVCRCLTEPKTGYGNLNRCLVVGNELRKQGFDVSFIVDKNKRAIHELKKKKFVFFISKTKSKINTNSAAFKKFPDIIILDMRQHGEPLSKQLSMCGYKTILFDDVWCKKIYSNVVINGTNVYAHHCYKKSNTNIAMYLGTKYWIIDKKFIKYAKKLSEIKKKNQYNITISMGGSDPNNLTYRVLKAIKEINNIRVTVIVGPFFKHMVQLKKLTSSNKIKLLETPNNIWKEFAKSDIVISNGGNTLFELVALHIPTLCIPAFEHEVLYAKQFSSENSIINLGLKQRNKEKIASTLINIINNLKLRKKLCLSTYGMIDGNGLTRVVDIIIDLHRSCNKNGMRTR